MLRKLRFKFILVNMVIVTIMLSLVVLMIYNSTCINLERESMQMMRGISMSPMHLDQPDGMPDDIRLPYLTILVDNDGKTSEIGGGFFDLSDERVINELLEMTKENGKKAGVLEDYNMRFLCTDTPMGQCYVYADMTSERAILRSLLMNSLLVGFAAFTVFFLIVLVISHWAVKPVEKAWAQQKQFVADASHELKTPLTVIMTSAELLNSQECSYDDREQLSSNIITMSAQMRGLVESMLELARVDGTAPDTVMGSLSLSEIVSNAAMVFEPILFEKDHFFAYEIEDELLMDGNTEHLKQLADILLDNAGKYASEGGQVTLSLKRTKQKKCLLEVANEGEEISKEELGKLFMRFYRADKARSMNKSYGLGLSIAQKIAEEHHGRIWAESAEGYNRFFVELPVK